MRPRCDQDAVSQPCRRRNLIQFPPASAAGRLNTLNEAPDVINEILQRSTRLLTDAITFPPCFSWRQAVGLTRSMTPSLPPALVQLSTLLPAVVGRGPTHRTSPILRLPS